MAYSDTIQGYVATITGFTPNADAYAPLNITTTLGLDTGLTSLDRVYLPSATSEPIQEIGSGDGNFQLTVYTGTLTSDLYTAVVPSFAPPGPPPAGHQIIGSVYSARSSGALLVTSQPMLLRMTYDPAALAGVDPHTLAIFGWDASARQWRNQGGTLFADQGYLSVATPLFGTYALMATPVWRDEFDDLSGLDANRTSNIMQDLLGDDLALTLASTPGDGLAVSRPITLTGTPARWDTLVFTGTASPPTTTLTVDVLSADGGAVLLPNLASGASLAGIDTAAHPAIRLRAHLKSTTAGQTPALAAWRLAWRAQGDAPRFYVHLPLVIR